MSMIASFIIDKYICYAALSMGNIYFGIAIVCTYLMSQTKVMIVILGVPVCDNLIVHGVFVMM